MTAGDQVQAGRQRVVIEGVTPEIDAGRFPVKRTLGERLQVEAVIFADGHDLLAAVLKYRPDTQQVWVEAPMEPQENDRWRAVFEITRVGRYVYTIEGWVDQFGTWRHDLDKKHKAGQVVEVELLAGALLLEAAAARAAGAAAEELNAAARTLRPEMQIPLSAKVGLATSARLQELMRAHAERKYVTRYERELSVWAEPVVARFGAWYEMFPRSAAPEPGWHGTFKDVEAWLPRIAAMGFDILYLPPVHPIGRAFRKGPNGSLKPAPDDPGSPWAIGSIEGGHKAVHPELGSLEDFRRLVQAAQARKIAVALDIAFQCSPDHPYVREHPEWFRHRPDGAIQYAENPPKKYQDIYPFDFECEQWRALWTELKSIFEFWIEQGVRIFRVDNPHTKSFRFWEWCIGELKQAHPDLVFLSEAFTRRPLMYYLAKLGFTQSYNYFPWRNTKRELAEYITELAHTEVREYFRMNLWPNTPDILTQYLQYGGKPAFVSRLILAAMLGASYGIYGPPFELGEHRAREFGSEEYLDSEKYQIRHWDLQAPGNLADLIAKVNRIRRENPALHSDWNVEFHPVDNDQLIAFSKRTPDESNLVLTIVNLDPHHTQHGWVELPVDRWGFAERGSYQVHELLTDARFLWSGRVNYVELNPHFVPAHIFRLRRFVRTEHDFDYFM